MASTASLSRPVPDRARQLAAELAGRFEQDADLAMGLNDAHERLQRANDRLWPGLQSDGIAAVYGDDAGVVDVAIAEKGHR